MKQKIICGLVLLAVSASSGAIAQEQGYTNISLEDVQKMISGNKEVLILDVRSKAEYDREPGHVKGAVNIPIGSVKFRLDAIEKHKNSNIVVYCSAGIRSVTVSKYLVKHGFTRILNLENGLMGQLRNMGENWKHKDEVLSGIPGKEVSISDRVKAMYKNDALYEQLAGDYAIDRQNGKYIYHVSIKDGLLLVDFDKTGIYSDLIPLEGRENEFEYYSGQYVLKFLKDDSGKYTSIEKTDTRNGRKELGMRIK